MSEKQIVRVLEAAKRGCNTTSDVSDVTGMPIAVASVHVSELIAAGLLRRTGRTIRKSIYGPAYQCFEPV